MSTNRRESILGLLDRIEEALGNDMLDRDVPIESVRASLHAAGVDSGTLRQDVAQLLEELHSEERATIRRGRRTRGEQDRRRLPIPGLMSPWLTREQLLTRVNALRSNPFVAARVVNRLRVHGGEDATEEELREILEELEGMLASDGEPEGDD